MSTRRATAAPISWSVILSDERSEKAIELRLVTSCLLSGKKCSLGSSREAAEFVLAVVLVGTLLWAYYQLSGEALPAHLHDAAGKIMPDKVFPFFLATKIPVGFAGLFMAALLS